MGWRMGLRSLPSLTHRYSQSSFYRGHLIVEILILIPHLFLEA